MRNRHGHPNALAKDLKGETETRDDCPESVDDRQPVDGYRFRCINRVYEHNAVIAFIDLLGTKRLYKDRLPPARQAEKIFDSLIWRFDYKFDKHFSTTEQSSFDVSIFADSIVASMRRKAPRVDRLLEFLLEYQEDLVVNCSLPSRAVLTKDSFFSFKISDASRHSILGSPHTSIALCGGKGIVLAHECLKGLPIGVYVSPQVQSELSNEQRARIVPVGHVDGYLDLSFIKVRGGLEKYLPHETMVLLREQPGASGADVEASIQRAFQVPVNAGPIAQRLNLDRPQSEVLRPAVQPDEPYVNDKWMQWILAHLGKQDEIVRGAKECGTS